MDLRQRRSFGWKNGNGNIQTTGLINICAHNNDNHMNIIFATDHHIFPHRWLITILETKFKFRIFVYLCFCVCVFDFDDKIFTFQIITLPACLPACLCCHHHLSCHHLFVVATRLNNFLLLLLKSKFNSINQ